MVSGATRGYFHRGSATCAPSTTGARIRLDHSLPARATKFVAVSECIQPPENISRVSDICIALVYSTVNFRFTIISDDLGAIDALSLDYISEM